jgi:chromosome transmission fidelity protein 18
MDFFGRPIAVAPARNKNKKFVKSSVERKPGVSFRYNEGNSAAVRRNVKVSAFM